MLLPLAVHAYTEAGLPRDCESLDTGAFKVLGAIVVDPATCMQVWLQLQEEARGSQRPVEAARASDMLEAVMADSHTFGFVATKAGEAFVCIRGTHFLSEWLKDADLPLVKCRFRADAGRAHIGFQAIYQTIQQSILDLLGEAKGKSVTVLGHSLGAALATLCALDEKVAAVAGALPAHVFPFASPRVGDGDFREVFNGLVSDCIRIVNKPDLVPHVPLPIGYRHVGVAAVVDSGATLDLAFAHGLCEGYFRGLNRTIAAPAIVETFD